MWNMDPVPCTRVPITKDTITAARRAYTEYCVYLDEQQRQKAAQLQRNVQLEKEQKDKKQLQKQKESLLKQLLEEDKAEQEQKREHDTAKELINEASKKMSAATETKNMQSVKVAQMMLKAGNEKLQEIQKLDTIGAEQKDVRKRLHGPDKEEAVKKRKTWTVSIY